MAQLHVQHEAKEHTKFTLTKLCSFSHHRKDAYIDYFKSAQSLTTVYFLIYTYASTIHYHTCTHAVFTQALIF